jgi:hypothetical protein
MPNPKVLVCHRLKNDIALTSMPLVDPLSRKRAILPALMHIVNASEHPRKPFCCIFFAGSELYHLLLGALK